ncbi:MAG: hypothetical protein WEC59_11395, partial [Salibacteraceae bacterium]
STTIEIWELLLVPLYLLVPIIIAFRFPNKEDRKWFSLGISARILGAAAYTLIYLYYYQGGDTIAYYNTAVPFVNLIMENPLVGLKVFFSGYSVENYANFTESTGYPLIYIYSEQNTFMVSRVITPFLLLSFNSYVLASILIASISFFGPWKLYQLFKTLVPHGDRIALISVIFFPSVIFWGSGISKDTITYASICYLTYGYYYTVIKRQLNTPRVLLSIITAYFILTIKPYIFLVFFPGALIWLFFGTIQRVKNSFLRVAIIPFILILSLGIFAFTFSSISDLLGDYSSAEKIIEKAVVSQEDLKRDYYGGNTFDIGTIEPTVTGILSKFPMATFFGLYGPTLIHINNIVMFFSALENTLLLLLTIAVLLFRNPIRSIKTIGTIPFMIFCFSFSIFLAFAIGLTTPNFGALVRFKIPLIPFFCFMLLVLYTKKEFKSNV